MSFLKATLAVFVKDLTIERRLGEIVLTTALFALLIVLLSAFAFDVSTISTTAIAAGVLWLAMAFSGVLALSRTFLREREFGAWGALLLSPVPASALYLGKMLGVFLYLLATAFVLIPAVALLFQAPMFEHLGWIALIVLLGAFGYAAVGTFFAAMTIRTRLRDLLTGIVLYPLIAPILISGVKATEVVLVGDGTAGLVFYLKLLLAIDAIYFVGALWLFGAVIDD